MVIACDLDIDLEHISKMMCVNHLEKHSNTPYRKRITFIIYQYNYLIKINKVIVYRS